MRNLLFGLCAITLMTQCKKDEVGSGCIESDFIGTYVGSNDCDGNSESATFTIAEVGGELVLTDDDNQSYTMDISDCSFDIPSLNLIIAEYSGDGSINGDQLTVNIRASALGFTSVCKFTGSK